MCSVVISHWWAAAADHQSWNRWHLQTNPHAAKYMWTRTSNSIYVCCSHHFWSNVVFTCAEHPIMCKNIGGNILDMWPSLIRGFGDDQAKSFNLRLESLRFLMYVHHYLLQNGSKSCPLDPQTRSGSASERVQKLPPKPDLHSKGKRVFVSLFLSELCQQAASRAALGASCLSRAVVITDWEATFPRQISSQNRRGLGGGGCRHPQGYYSTDVTQNEEARASAVQRNRLAKSVIRVCHNQQGFILQAAGWKTYWAFLKRWKAQMWQLQIAARNMSRSTS